MFVKCENIGGNFILTIPCQGECHKLYLAKNGHIGLSHHNLALERLAVKMGSEQYSCVSYADVIQSAFSQQISSETSFVSGDIYEYISEKRKEHWRRLGAEHTLPKDILTDCQNGQYDDILQSSNYFPEREKRICCIAARLARYSLFKIGFYDVKVRMVWTYDYSAFDSQRRTIYLGMSWLDNVYKQKQSILQDCFVLSVDRLSKLCLRKDITLSFGYYLKRIWNK